MFPSLKTYERSLRSVLREITEEKLGSLIGAKSFSRSLQEDTIELTTRVEKEPYVNEATSSYFPSFSKVKKSLLPIAKSIGWVVVGLTITAGMVHLAVAGRAPRLLPKVASISRVAPELKSLLNSYPTKNVVGKSPEVIWESLKPTRKIVEKICPEIGNWLNEEYRAGNIIFHSTNCADETFKDALPILKYEDGKLHVFRTFLEYQVRDQVPAFCHEYIHTPNYQDWLFNLDDKITATFTGKIGAYGGTNRENIPFLFQRDVYQNGLELSPDDVTRQYLREQGLAAQ